MEPRGLQLQCRVSQGERPRACCEQPRHLEGSPSRVLSLQSTLLLQGAWGRPVLYQVVARYNYRAQRPEDLDLHQGDTVDVLCEGKGCPLLPDMAGMPGLLGLRPLL